ncbi:MAG: radical SAM protein [Elusimicrobiota bacterium]
MKFNKEIAKFKIAVTSRCCLRCTHCFIDKSREETIPLAAALRAADAFLRSPGASKTLEIYGGEPLMEFVLVKKIITAARAAARRLGKDLAVSVASNGMLAERRHLEYMAENGIRLSVSFSGGRKTNDLTRRLPSGRGASPALEKKLPLLLSVPGLGLHVIFCVHPLRAASALGDFKRLVALGFRNIGIECVHGFPWRERDCSAFGRAMRDITAFTAEKAAAGDFIVLEPLMELFCDKSRSFCPFLRDLEMYPDGTLSLYPYPFVKTPAQRKKISVGSVESGLIPRFRDCRPDPGSAACSGCVAAYYRLPGLEGGSRAYRLRTDICLEAARGLVARAASERPIRDYLRLLIKLFKRGGI